MITQNFQYKLTVTRAALASEADRLFTAGKHDASQAIVDFLKVAPADSVVRLHDILTAKQEG